MPAGLLRRPPRLWDVPQTERMLFFDALQDHFPSDRRVLPVRPLRRGSDHREPDATRLL